MHKTIQAIENDHKALSKELHDSIGGTLSAIKFRLEERVDEMGKPLAEISMSIEKIIDYVGCAIDESRRITKQLRPSVLDDFGLSSAVEECIRDFERFYPKVVIQGWITVAEDELSGDIKTVVYRVLQESLNSVGKHSRAKHFQIELHQNQDSIWLHVQDDGVGFDSDEVINNHQVLTGYGLQSMKEHVEICKCQFSISSAPGNGTSIHVAIPLTL